jgi:hypothetical protein
MIKVAHFLLALFFTFALILVQNANSEPLGTVAGRVYSFIDDTDVAVAITLRQYDADIINSNDTAYKIDSDRKPICIQKFMNGTFFCDSIPAGYYEAEIKGFPFDEDFEVVKKSKPIIFRPVRIAPDSISLLITRLRADHPNYKSLESPQYFLWEENILPDTSETYFICGWHSYNIDRDIFNQFNLEREGYFCNLRYEIDNESKQSTGCILKVQVSSKRLYDTPGEIIMEETKSGYDIYLNLSEVFLEGEDSLILYREPVSGIHEILLAPGSYTVHVIASDTSSVVIDYKAGDFNFDVVRSGAVEFLY